MHRQLDFVSQLILRVFHKQLWQTHSVALAAKKKDPVKTENKLKAFIKRSSEPLLHGSTPQNQQLVSYYIHSNIIQIESHVKTLKTFNQT